MKRLTIASVATALLLAGCAGQDGPADTAADSPQTTSERTTGESEGAQQILAEHGLQDLDTSEVIDRLDRLAGEERPADLMASVRPDELQLVADGREASLPIPDDRFYLSVAPYVDQTHDCFYHSLTTCQGELGGEDVDVRIVDTGTGEVIVDENRTTFANGFVGFWLPRDIEGTLEVVHDGKAGRTPISTDADAPTCLTTLQLT